MPMLGYGVFQIKQNETKRCVADALSCGYRLIDTAQAYYNEREVGAAIAKSGIERSDIFLVDKVWVSNYGRGTTYDSIQSSLKILGTDYIDLMLLHQPYNDYYAAWRDMERALDDGLVRAIGVSNFDPVRLLDLCTFAKSKPAVNQIETHVFWQQEYAHQNMKDLNIQHMSWGPFAEGAHNFFANPVLTKIGKAHNKTTGQVALRYLIDSDVIVIPKSTHMDRIRENFDIFDFALTNEEKKQIASLDTHHSTVFDHTDTKVIGGLLDFIKKGL